MMILERNAKLFAGAVVLATIAIGCSTASDEGKVTFSMSRNDSQTYSFPAGAVFEPSEFPNWRAIAEERFRLANSFEAKASELQSKSSERDLMTAADLYIAAARFGNTGAVDTLKTGIKSEAWTYHSQEISDGEIFDATAALDHGVYFLNEKGIVRNRAPFHGEILVKDPKSKGVVRLRSGMSIKEVKAAAGARGVKFNPISPDALAIASTTLRFEANRLSQLELGKLTLSQAEKGATAHAYWEARKRKTPNASGDGAYRVAMGLLKSDERRDKLLEVTLLQRAAEIGQAESH